MLDYEGFQFVGKTTLCEKVATYASTFVFCAIGFEEKYFKFCDNKVLMGKYGSQMGLCTFNGGIKWHYFSLGCCQCGGGIILLLENSGPRGQSFITGNGFRTNPCQMNDTLFLKYPHYLINFLNTST